MINVKNLDFNTLDHMKSHGPKVKWVTPIVSLIRNTPVLPLTRNSFCMICSFCKRINWIELQDRKRKSWLGAGRLEGGGLSSTITKELAPQMLNSLVKNGGPGHRHNIFFILITIIIIMTVVISISLIKDGSGQGVPTYVVETRSLLSCLAFSFN